MKHWWNKYKTTKNPWILKSHEKPSPIKSLKTFIKSLWFPEKKARTFEEEIYWLGYGFSFIVIFISGQMGDRRRDCRLNSRERERERSLSGSEWSPVGDRQLDFNKEILQSWSSLYLSSLTLLSSIPLVFCSYHVFSIIPSSLHLFPGSTTLLTPWCSGRLRFFKGTVSWDRVFKICQKFTELGLTKGRGWFLIFSL